MTFATDVEAGDLRWPRRGSSGSRAPHAVAGQVPASRRD